MSNPHEDVKLILGRLPYDADFLSDVLYQELIATKNAIKGRHDEQQRYILEVLRCTWIATIVTIEFDYDGMDEDTRLLVILAAFLLKDPSLGVGSSDAITDAYGESVASLVSELTPPRTALVASYWHDKIASLSRLAFFAFLANRIAVAKTWSDSLAYPRWRTKENVRDAHNFSKLTRSIFVGDTRALRERHILDRYLGKIDAWAAKYQGTVDEPSVRIAQEQQIEFQRIAIAAMQRNAARIRVLDAEIERDRLRREGELIRLQMQRANRVEEERAALIGLEPHERMRHFMSLEEERERRRALRRQQARRAAADANNEGLEDEEEE